MPIVLAVTALTFHSITIKTRHIMGKTAFIHVNYRGTTDTVLPIMMGKTVSVKQKIRDVVRKGQHWDWPTLVKEKVNPILRGWGNYFKTGNSRKHFLSIANYTIWTLCIMLRKKHKKRGKGWRDHPPSWFYDYHGLFKLYSLSVTGDEGSRYARPVPS